MVSYYFAESLFVFLVKLFQLRTDYGSSDRDSVKVTGDFDKGLPLMRNYPRPNRARRSFR